MPLSSCLLILISPLALRYFCVNGHTIVAILALQKSSSTIAIIRDASGRHCYRLSPSWLSSSANSSPSQEKPSSRKAFAPKATVHSINYTESNTNNVITCDQFEQHLATLQLLPKKPHLGRPESTFQQERSSLVSNMCNRQLQAEQEHGIDLVG